VDGSGAKGDYIEDEFAIGSTSSYASAGQARILLQMGLATDTTINTGIMGIGYDNNEAVTNTTKQYQNFMDEMVSNDLTNTKLYSLWLNDLDSSTGSILFGGIDTEKYYGTLYSNPPGQQWTIHCVHCGAHVHYVHTTGQISHTHHKFQFHSTSRS
jgi:hypothetical protein